MGFGPLWLVLGITKRNPKAILGLPICRNPHVLMFLLGSSQSQRRGSPTKTIQPPKPRAIRSLRLVGPALHLQLFLQLRLHPLCDLPTLLPDVMVPPPIACFSVPPQKLSKESQTPPTPPKKQTKPTPPWFPWFLLFCLIYVGVPLVSGHRRM